VLAQSKLFRLYALVILIESLKNVWFKIEWLESLNSKLIFSLKVRFAPRAQ